MEIISNIFFGILVLINNVFVLNFKNVDIISGNITNGVNKKILQWQSIARIKKMMIAKNLIFLRLENLLVFFKE